MDRDLSTPFCAGLLALLLMVQLQAVHGRSFLIQENQLAPGRDVTDFQDKLIALLLQKGVSGKSGRRSEINDLELASKLAELEQLAALREKLDLEKQLDSNAIGMESAHPSKRACFWKYCV
ncbi:urotensin-2B-like [Polyodon spathula]|uniref:urotensin-2B-like n=1 Tax=Polyodon spathula TaxID=7913 RepID=UPI001B7E014D|nr:urotensin-2B-like [Polyodon spathula]